MTITETLFSFRGRIRRTTFWAVMPQVFVLSVGLRVLTIAAGDHGTATFLLALQLLLIIPTVWVSLAIYVKRWHDAGQSGWMTLTMLIPLVNLVVLLVLGILHPSRGPNRYGPDPRTPDATNPLRVLHTSLFALSGVLLVMPILATPLLIVLQFGRIDGQSMAPTFEDQDRLIIDKLTYQLQSPRRGEIVMLYYPVDPSKSFVKRVIAEETETVQIKEGRVYVNDVLVPDDFVPDDYRSHDSWGPQVVPEGYYFVLGDHRNASADSRHWGMVPKKYIFGRVWLRWWPIRDARVY